MNNALNNFIINLKQRLSNSMLIFTQQQTEKVYENFIVESENFKFHTYKAIIISVLCLGAIFITKNNIISLSLDNQSFIHFFSWLLFIFMGFDLVTNCIAYFLKKVKYKAYFNYMKNHETVKKLIDDFLTHAPKNYEYYEFSSYLRLEDFNSRMSQDEVSALLSLPLNLNQKQYLYDLISKKGITLSDLEHLQSIDNYEEHTKKHLYLIK